MNQVETKQDTLDTCGRRGGGGCAPADTPDFLMPAYWRGEVVILASASRKAFSAPSTDQPQ